MKKLEDIPKKQVFDVPEGYFDTLPGVIQSRVAERSASKTRPVMQFALRYALPAMIVVIAVVLWFRPIAKQTTESILASIATEDLVAYLDDTDITTEEVLESVDLNETDLEDIETEVYNLNVEDEDLDALLDEIDDHNL